MRIPRQQGRIAIWRAKSSMSLVPDYSAVFDKKVGLASALTPNRWFQRWLVLCVQTKAPMRGVVRKEADVNDCAASAWAGERGSPRFAGLQQVERMGLQAIRDFPN